MILDPELREFTFEFVDGAKARVIGISFDISLGRAKLALTRLSQSGKGAGAKPIKDYAVIRLKAVSSRPVETSSDVVQFRKHIIALEAQLRGPG